jgi:signal transduction histidine kinase
VRAFWLLVIVPLATAGYLAVRVARDGAASRAHELDGLLAGRLADVGGRAKGSLAGVERELGAALGMAPTTADELRALARRIPLAHQIFRVDAHGKLVFPVDDADASREEREFLARTAAIWGGGAILDAGAAGADGPTANAPAVRPGAPGVRDSLVDLAARRDHGWLTWYWAEGLHLLYWCRAADGGVIGVEVERIAVIARVVGALPTAGLAAGRIELVDAEGDVVHQWGPMIPAEDAVRPAPDAVAALATPLDTWELRYYLGPDQRAALTGGRDPALLLGLAALALAVIGLAIYIHRELTRRLREAARRVGFVTQVSHELRTPLTNIRMYAELVEEDAVTADDTEQARRAHVIVDESQRLARLIDNVLAFARHQRGTLAVRPARVDVDAAVTGVVAQFTPALAARGIAVELGLGAPPPARADADAVDQIVANLLSNVEKYAATGGGVAVTTRSAEGRVIVGVADRGPGVPAGHKDAIFEPFHRASDAVTEGATGTGIGLTISRALARAAGGDLVLVASERGACFELSLPIAEAAA